VATPSRHEFVASLFQSLFDYVRFKDDVELSEAVRTLKKSRKFLYACICLYGTMLRMKRTALFLKEEQLRKLQAMSAKTGAPVAELIRRAVDAFLKKEK